MTSPRVAIAHDHLVQRGGAERLVATMARAFPGAPIYTSVYEPTLTYPELADLDVRPLALNRFDLFRLDHRRVLPALLVAFPRLKIDADVVLCSSAGWAHSVRTTGRKVVYWHSPNRWIHSPKEALAGRFPALRVALQAGRAPLRRWDRAAVATAALHIANSTAVQRRLRDLYGVDAVVLHPPCMLEPGPEDALPGVEPGYVLLVSRLQPYKNVDAVVAAFASVPERRLLVIGAGARAAPLRATAPGNVTFVDEVSDASLRWAYHHAVALVAPAIEDFGLTPVEAAAFGTPTAALRSGGYLDTVVEGTTGVLFERPDPAAIADAVGRVLERGWDDAALVAHAARFSRPEFQRTLHELVTQCAP